MSAHKKTGLDNEVCPENPAEPERIGLTK